MSDLIPYGEQFKKIVDIIESAKERAYRKVNGKKVYGSYSSVISVKTKAK